mmetsp:Transcript_692/g.756  ORF Transcript_692/g.756 Transcript_692/m.756 type:complete len:87 (-) Transcript_692:320-580(-)
MFAFVLFINNLCGLIQSVSQLLDFLVVLSTDGLQLQFHCLLEVFLVLLHLPLLVLLPPSLEHSPQLVSLLLLQPVNNHLLIVLSFF